MSDEIFDTVDSSILSTEAEKVRFFVNVNLELQPTQAGGHGSGALWCGGRMGRAVWVESGWAGPCRYDGRVGMMGWTMWV